MMATILDPVFLTSILIQRRNLRTNGYRAPSSPSIVTWIDTILFRIGEAIIRLADPPPNSAGSRGISALLRCTKFVKDEDKFRAVSQLPDDWTAFPGLLASPRIPPLSRRLILTLLFGVYIVAPTLVSSGTGSGTDCTAKSLPPNLRGHLRSYMSLRINEERGVTSPLDDNDLNPLPYASLLDRAEYAMALSLFALTEHTPHIVDSIERFRPHTLSNIFVLLLTVIQPSTDSSELQGSRRLSTLQTLDPAHRVLLDCNYGRHFVSWTWSAWDVRSPHYSIITFLTISWLHQLAHWRQTQQSESYGDVGEDEVSHSILVKELSVILAVLSMPCTSSRVLSVIS
ncbi:hypothetical protein BS47DRAFT_73958 [Hydnum rufescens UP504]|uniref:Uncharacterized protein n=1 Tax=Hydnum rufescens UP504 TaxID=1448309 RepID=A0A9P6B7V7_9AGAM|nr:hypothetical protein BS47DRAFT_73958 [Hydnum rufescens UP504]